MLTEQKGPAPRHGGPRNGVSSRDALRRHAEWTAQGTGRLSDANIPPILNAVGKTLVRADIDKMALIRGLNLCARWYREARMYSTNKSVKDREHRLTMIYKKAKALNYLLAEDDSWMPIGAPASSMESFRISIRRIINLIDHTMNEQNSEPGKAYQDSFKIRSPFEWLVGFYLPDVFVLMSIAPIQDQKEFLSSKSPYIHFAQAVLGELRIGVDGQPYSSATIIKGTSDQPPDHGILRL
jgi:hypothetical protein